MLLSVLAVPGAAQAQDRQVVGLIGIGPTAVFSTAGDYVGTGFNFDFGVLYKPRAVFGVSVETLITKHDVDDEVTGRLNVGDGDAWWWHLSANALVSTPMSRPVSVYGIGGLGVYYRRTNLTNPGVGLITVCDPWLLICYPVAVEADEIVGERASTDFGMNVGAGVNFRVGPSASIFMEFRYHHVWGPAVDSSLVPQPLASGSQDTNNQFMPFTFGVRF
jgi:opacity protein-like surface antigen